MLIAVIRKPEKNCVRPFESTENAENSGAAMSKLRSSSLASTSTTASSIDQAGFNEKMQKLRNELELLQVRQKKVALSAEKTE